MASVRKAPFYNEVGGKWLTFFYDSSIVYDPSDIATDNHSAQVGMAVGLVSDSTVGLGAALASAAKILRGVVVAVESDGACTVQTGGVCKCPYLVGTPPIVGRGVTIDGAGNVTSASAGPTATETATAAQVLSLDSTNLVAYVLLPF